MIFENNKNYVGKSLKVLYEGIDYDNNIFYGRPEFCAPEVDAKVLFSSDNLVTSAISTTLRLPAQTDTISLEK